MPTAEYIERYYSGLTIADLKQHVRFCGRALAKDSSAMIVLNNKVGRIPIWKRTYKTKPNCLELQISAGYIERHVIEAAVVKLRGNDVPIKTKLTPKRKALSRIITSHDIDDAYTPKNITDIIIIINSLYDNEACEFSIEYCCNFEENYTIEDGDPVVFSKTYRFGRSIGRAVGAIKRHLKLHG